ncbi:MAG: hypothetical protein V4644_03560 [Patescibacteria group bacterium]
MALSKKTTNLLIAGTIVVLGVAAYLTWMRPTDEENVSVEGLTEATEVQATFLTLAAQLDPVAFDADILSDPRFTALVDIKTAILPENSGRTDPFAPLPGIPAQ